MIRQAGGRAHLPISVALLVTTALPAVAVAQDEVAANPTIVVTGRGLEDSPATPAYDTQEIPREALITTASGRIEDVLDSVAGFQQFRRSDSRSSNPSAQGATLRALGGNASSRAQVLLDGVPMADPFFGYIPFSAIAPERLAHVRVTRGGGSGPFGAGSLAGTIELTSADADTLGLFSGQALINDRAETETSATLAGKLGGGFATLSGRWDRGKGFYTTPEDQRVDATARAAYDAWSVQARGVIPVGEDVEVQARGLAYEDRRTLRFDGADTGMEGQDASLRLVGRGAWQFDALAYIQARNFTNIVVSSRSFTPTLDQRNTPATGTGGKIELRPPVGDSMVLRLGADLRHSDGELFEDAISTTTGSVTARRRAGGNTTDLGFFAEDDVTLGTLTLTAGLRADYYAISDGFYVERDATGTGVNSANFYPDRSGWETSFRGGAVARIGGGLALRAAAYTGLRLPTLNELYRPFTVFPVVTLANAALLPEKLEGYEVGADFEPSSAVKLSLTAFDNKVKDAVANVTIGTNLRQRLNIEAIRARGIEGSATLTFGRFSLSGSAAYTDAEARQPGADFDGLRPAQTPRWIAGATIGFRPAANWLFAGSVRHVGAQFEDDLQVDVQPAFTTFDVFMQVPVTRTIALLLRGENLTDETIVTRNQAGSIDLGTPRTIWGGIRIGL